MGVRFLCLWAALGLGKWALGSSPPSPGCQCGYSSRHRSGSHRGWGGVGAGGAHYARTWSHRHWPPVWRHSEGHCDPLQPCEDVAYVHTHPHRHMSTHRAHTHIFTHGTHTGGTCACSHGTHIHTGGTCAHVHTGHTCTHSHTGHTHSHMAHTYLHVHRAHVYTCSHMEHTCMCSHRAHMHPLTGHMHTHSHNHTYSHTVSHSRTNTLTSQSHSGHTETPVGHLATGTATECHPITSTQPGLELHWDHTQAEIFVGTQHNTQIL